MSEIDTADRTVDHNIYRQHYRVPDFFVDHVTLHVELGEHTTRVRSKLALRRNGDHFRPLVLDGRTLTLLTVHIDNVALNKAHYHVNQEQLIIDTALNRFQLEIENAVHPDRNTALTGLYRSAGNFCTQCEAEGFRRITYFLDRPDVLSRYTVTLRADKHRYPVLLCNGNLVARGETGDERHWVTWEDPHPKPSYLFALVAGDLACLEDEFTTMSGRKAGLMIYAQRHNIDKCGHAMQSLKKAMRWDEERYGREYDLSIYMVVVIDDFNMGAMENKGLNLFNSRYVLAKPDTATDGDYQHIEAVVAHEYFHNWSGNRVTCRDWFQLSLKEGFTVFRDQQFSADMGSAAVKRIQDVNLLRTQQFREDAGPMAHPVRPDSYQEINNFYTVTIYNKGAEVVRMLHRLLGANGFRRGCDYYFNRFDGQAATTDDFLAAMEQANGVDLTQFRRWYDQAGTPEVKIATAYDPDRQTYTLDVVQWCPPTPGQREKQPFHIPLTVALLGKEGQPLELHLRANGTPPAREQVLSVRDTAERFVFEGVPEAPVLSALRGFSAPVKLHMERAPGERYLLMSKDTDPYSRWNASIESAAGLIIQWIERPPEPLAATPPSEYVDAFRANLLSDEPDRAYIAELLRTPSEAYIADLLSLIDPDTVHSARELLRSALARALASEFAAVYERNHDTGVPRLDADAVGRRALKNACLSYLAKLDDPHVRQIIVHQFDTATNMTDSTAALTLLNDMRGAERVTALETFYSRWEHEPLVIDKWFSIQGASSRTDTLARVVELTRHPAFNIRNPNRVRAVLGTFAHANPVRFHDPTGAGYRFIADWVRKLDALNPQLAAYLMTGFNHWRRYEKTRSALMTAQIQRILGTSDLSGDVREIGTKSLGGVRKHAPR